MTTRLVAVLIGSSLAVGFGFGFGLGISNQPLVLEATGTPFGSFVLRCNLPQMSPPASLPGSGEENPVWNEHIA